MSILGKLGFKITQVLQGNTTFSNKQEGMTIESEVNENTGRYEWHLFDSSETLVFSSHSTSDIAKYLEGK